MTSLPLVTSDRSPKGSISFRCFLNRSSFLPTSKYEIIVYLLDLLVLHQALKALVFG